MYDNQYIQNDLNYYNYPEYYHYLVNIGSYNFDESSSLLNAAMDGSVKRMLAKLYDTEGRQSHLLWYNMSGDHSNNSDDAYDIGDDETVKTVVVTFLNKKMNYNGQWVDIVHIYDQEMGVKGYYVLIQDGNEFCYNLIWSDHLPQGYLQVTGSMNCKMLKIALYTHQPVTDVKARSKLAYDNYCQDLKAWQHYQCDYNTYMIHIIG